MQRIKVFVQYFVQMSFVKYIGTDFFTEEVDSSLKTLTHWGNLNHNTSHKINIQEYFKALCKEKKECHNV